MPKQKIEGVGLGLRFPHFQDILEVQPEIPWFEVITDDFLDDGPHWDQLLKVRENYPIVFHSIGLNLGGTDDFNTSHLNRFKEIYSVFQPLWISDHLCWSAHDQRFHHDLLPIPRTQEGFENVCSRISYLQDFFKRPLSVENITRYVDFEASTISEEEFIQKIIAKTGCSLLLDLSNLLINQKNLKESAQSILRMIPYDKVSQIHLSGGEAKNDTIIDTHSQEVLQEDIELLAQLRTEGLNAPAMIERDSNLPSFAELESERKRIAEALNEL